MTIKYLDSKRISGLSNSTTTSNANATWITSTKINATVETNNNITFSGVGAIDAKDEITIGSGASGNVIMTPNLGSGNHNTRLTLNLIEFNTTNATGSFQKYAWVFNTSGTSTRWTRIYVDGSEVWNDNTDWTGGGGVYKIEVTGTTVKFYNGSTLKYTKTGATTGTYKVHSNSGDAGNGEMNAVKTDGFSVPNSDYTTLTNVQDNSIFVETDTAKRYWFNGTTWVLET